MEWISVEEKLPRNEQDVITYFYDEVSERDEVNYLTYFRKGDVMHTKIDRDINKTKLQRFMSTMLNRDLEVIAPGDGFYIFEWGENGDTQARKHKDCITHWMPLPKAPVE